MNINCFGFDFDLKVPSSAMAMLDFLQKVREQQAKMVNDLGDTWAGHPKGPPIVVSTGLTVIYSFRLLYHLLINFLGPLFSWNR